MIKIFEMFAGYGGASWGLKKANTDYECVGISEIDGHAILCFDRNFPNIKNFGDCSKIKTEKLPDFDLLTGGFPCQDVSIAGKRDLSIGRTNLYEEILRIAKDKKPKFMLLENVRGLLSMKIDERDLRCKIISDLNKIGYDVCFKLLNSKDYGIPQNRERVWFVCKLGKWGFGEFMFPNKEVNCKIKDILESDADIKYFLTEKQIAQHKRWNEKFKQGNQVHSINEICSCLCHGQKSGFIISIDDRLRYLTEKESFRLMGFLNDEIDLGNLGHYSYSLAGNGWDISLVSKLFKEMFKNEIE